MEAESMNKKCKYCLMEGVWWDEEHECSNKPIPVSEVINNPDHPGHEEIKQLLEDIKAGKVSFS